MSNKQLVKGGSPSMSSMYYWYTNNTSIISTAYGSAYHVRNKGYLKQTSRQVFVDSLEVSLLYTLDDGNGECNIILKCDDDTTLVACIILNECQDTTLGNLTIEIPDAIKVISTQVSIEYKGGGHCNIYNISMLYNDSSEVISYANDFVNKSIMYGFESDLPILGGGSNDSSD